MNNPSKIVALTAAAFFTVGGVCSSYADPSPGKIEACEIGKEQSDAAGYFDEPSDNGRYDEYCFVLRADGTMIYSDAYDGETAGTWKRDGETVEWKGEEKYSGYDDLDIDIWGTIKGAEFDAGGKLVSHDGITWWGRRPFGQDFYFTGSAYDG